MKRSLLILISALVLMACEQGLQPVTGFQGTVYFPTDSTGTVAWPDSLNGAVVAFVDAEALNFPNLSFSQLVRNILGFTNPLDLSRDQQPYFLEALPGKPYLAGVIASTVPIGSLLGLPTDSLAAHPEYFHVLGLYHTPGGSLPFKFIYVDQEEITPGIDIHCDFNYQLSF